MNIVLFDGMCSFCDAGVGFIMRHDSRQRFRIGALQSPEAAPLLAKYGIDAQTLSSMIYIDASGVYRKSTAVLMIARGLDGPWHLAGALLRLPLPLRDAVYDFVAKNRYRFFHRRESCRLPTPEERDRFLSDGELEHIT